VATTAAARGTPKPAEMATRGDFEDPEAAGSERSALAMFAAV
jgi:hypothetical protein